MRFEFDAINKPVSTPRHIDMLKILILRRLRSSRLEG
jgi:hypothetical protein